jgi:acetyl-CoA carboxylase carboxyltransferase component
MDGWAAEKYAHFVDLCDAFNLPVVIFLDMPGFMLGSHAERKATMRRGVRALIASAEAEVPKIEFNVRKAYGVAADAPHSLGHPNGLNLRFGWPAGEWGGIPIEGGVAATYRREIENAPDPEAHRAMIENRLLRLRSPFRAAYKGRRGRSHRPPRHPDAGVQVRKACPAHAREAGPASQARSPTVARKD